ncbi:MAG: proline dehydrogenase family protein [Salibacteraceae bacterium]
MAVDFNNTELGFKHKSNGELKFTKLILQMLGNSSLTNVMTGLTGIALNLKLPIAWAVKPTIFKQFCGGTSIQDSEKTFKMLASHGIEAILDYSVEGKENEKSFDDTQAELLKLIENAKQFSKVPTTCLKVTGLGRFGVFQKVSENAKLNQAEKLEYNKIIQRLDSICKKANNLGVKIYIDAEESWIQIAIDRLAEVMMRKYNKEKAIVYTTLQLYRHDKVAYLNDLIGMARGEKFILGVKLVRGAYMEKENERADKLGYPTPIQPDKTSCDNDYNKALSIVVDNIDVVEVCAGSHNENSAYHLISIMKEKDLDNNHPNIFFSQLYGMSDNISYNLAHAGYNVSKYLPYGPVIDTVPYLIRRAEENTSVAGQMGKELKLVVQELTRRKS